MVPANPHSTSTNAAVADVSDLERASAGPSASGLRPLDSLDGHPRKAPAVRVVPALRSTSSTEWLQSRVPSVLSWAGLSPQGRFGSRAALDDSVGFVYRGWVLAWFAAVGRAPWDCRG